MIPSSDASLHTPVGTGAPRSLAGAPAADVAAPTAGRPRASRSSASSTSSSSSRVSRMHAVRPGVAWESSEYWLATLKSVPPRTNAPSPPADPSEAQGGEPVRCPSAAPAIALDMRVRVCVATSRPGPPKIGLMYVRSKLSQRFCLIFMTTSPGDAADCAGGGALEAAGGAGGAPVLPEPAAWRAALYEASRSSALGMGGGATPGVERIRPSRRTTIAVEHPCTNVVKSTTVMVIDTIISFSRSLASAKAIAPRSPAHHISSCSAMVIGRAWRRRLASPQSASTISSRARVTSATRNAPNARKPSPHKRCGKSEVGPPVGPPDMRKTLIPRYKKTNCSDLDAMSLSTWWLACCASCEIE
mmetsp:Transcript_18089/g.46730  ORF Transcript_18089/g.46730 Transcript_18089/m.46730 type:complete len:359 (-) Transcript_18089:234-1310(-)